MEFVEQLDRALFIALNGFHSELFDQIMWHISGKWQWIPLYLFLIYLIIKKFKKKSWIIIVSVAVLIFLNDQLSVHLFKENFERYRPCHNLEIQDQVHLVNGKCGGKYGFLSNHASNTFALATFIGLLLGRRATILLFIWASVVAYSRIYLGVHYPLDVIVGAIFGILLAYLMHLLMINLFKKQFVEYA